MINSRLADLQISKLFLFGSRSKIIRKTNSVCGANNFKSVKLHYLHIYLFLKMMGRKKGL